MEKTQDHPITFKQKLKVFWAKRWKVIKSIPWWGWASGVILICLQYGTYRLADAIAHASGTIAWAYIPKIPFDDAIPLVPFFVLIYVYSYPFWIMGPVAISLTKKENYLNFVIGYICAILIGGIILTAAPTYMDRNAEGLIDIGSRGGFLYWLLGLIYGSDGGARNYNLLPSFHCLTSLYMYLAIAKRKEISFSFRVYTLIMVILISLSTVFTKQHYVLDIFVGYAIALVAYFTIKLINPGQKIMARLALKVIHK
ncbi:MAG: phosphatase PAP2 family protein [Bacilli bacterium]|nr:phosphatase PAP2 family protein [Bacilli bacterium]